MNHPLTVERATLSDLQDWALAGPFGLGHVAKRSGFIILPHHQGYFQVWFHEHCPINEPKYRRAEIKKAETAMLALASFLRANKYPFSFYLVGTQMRFTVNGTPPEPVENRKIRYFFALHMEEVLRNSSYFSSSSFANRMEDDGK
jgi:hypothetical protein